MVKKIFVCASGKRNTGGTESLHQLVSTLRNDGMDAYIYYVDSNRTSVDSNFKNLNVKIADKIIDTANNAVVVPEVYTGKLRKINESKKIIWWLSKDFYFKDRPDVRIGNVKNKHPWLKLIPTAILEYVGIVMGRFLSISVNYLKELELSNSNIFHLYNCEYVKSFLIDNGVSDSNLQYLCGPIDQAFFNSKKLKKKQQICYNPSKGYKYLKPVKQYIENNYPDIKFIALKGMNRDELVKAYKESKLYVDFGFFPGPERMPREAVMSFCNLLTGRFGSSDNSVDIPIPRKFKLDINNMSVAEIAEKITLSMLEYDKNEYLYDGYRNKVITQKNNFMKNVNKVEEYINH